MQTESEVFPPGLISRLSLSGSGAVSRLRALPAAPPEVELPDDTTARRLLDHCSVTPADQDAMLAARPDPVDDADWWWLLRATMAEMRGALDTPMPSTGYRAWPVVDRGTGDVGMFLYAWALLAMVPDVLQLHARHGIPDQVGRATLADLGGVMHSHLEVTGRRGVGLFPLWGPPQSFTGIDYTIGRHSFTRALLAAGGHDLAHILLLHIPPYGPLVESESKASIEQALTLFASGFPDEPPAALVCTSWILDPQLRDYLSPTSNLLRFQERFQLLPHVPLDDPHEDDREMLRLGLQVDLDNEGPVRDEILDAIPQDTTLQRAVVTHLRSGRHWHKRTGLIWLPV